MTATTVDPAARGRTAPMRTLLSWISWDFGSNAFNTVMWSFVFSVYATSGLVAPSKEVGQQVWANMQTASGFLLAVLAPLMGAWADRVQNRRLMLTVSTLIVVVSMASCWYVRPGHSMFYVVLGTGLLALTNLVQEIAGVFYNGMLLEISSPRTIGRISGAGWGAGYFGGVLCLAIVLFGFVQGGPGGTGLLGLPGDDSLNLRAIAPFCALFLLVSSLPIMIWGPKGASVVRADPFNPVRAYADIFQRIIRMWRDERSLLHFLLASAVYRDGLAAVFAFAGTIAASEYGFSPAEVIVFGLAANFIAAVGTWVLGLVDDLVGPRTVIIGALVTMVTAGVVVVVAHDKLVFWVGGMVISSMVGAVQSSSRTLLTRVIPPGEENETFGLYATVGRAVSFIAPGLVAIITAVAGARYGLLGVVLTLLLGLALFVPLRIDGVTHGHRRDRDRDAG
ncbi:MFS transporter [Mariniluteicoccus endophyticus]